MKTKKHIIKNGTEHIVKHLILRHCTYCGVIAEWTIDDKSLCNNHYIEESRYLKHDKTSYSVKGIQSNWQEITGIINKELARRQKPDIQKSEVKGLVIRQYLITLLDKLLNNEVELLISYDGKYTLEIEYNSIRYIILVPLNYRSSNPREDLVTGAIEPVYSVHNGKITQYYK